MLEEAKKYGVTELDWLVATLVMGWHYDNGNWVLDYEHDVWKRAGDFRPSAVLNHAWQVVEHISGQKYGTNGGPLRISIKVFGDDPVSVDIAPLVLDFGAEFEHWTASGTVQEAICNAALRFVGWET